MSELSDLLAITPIDGRYREDVKELVPYSSEKALIQNRLMIEVEYLIALQSLDITKFSSEECATLRGLYQNLSDADAQMIKDIETKGVAGINKGKKTDHDMKAVELFMRNKLAGSSIEDRLALIHVCLTSEDVNNLAYTLMLKNGVYKCLMPALVKLEERLISMAKQYNNSVMPGRTHGQFAIPTTVGKELAVFAYRIVLQLHDLVNIKLKGKLNGAIGNYSAFYVAYPDKDWQAFSKKFVESFGLEHNPLTTQIEPHDSMADLFQKIMHINTILIGTDQDLWNYISDEYFVQKKEEGTVGSSTMPQKINPIKFENSEGNLGIANSLLNYFANKLPISRFQRDLSDSTVQRWIGTALAASLLAYKNTLRGLNKCEPNMHMLDQELDEHWEMLAEPIQQILRREGVDDAYNILKDVTQGKKWTKNSIIEFAQKANLDKRVYDEIVSLEPHTYIGKAKELTTQAITYVKNILYEVKQHVSS